MKNYKCEWCINLAIKYFIDTTGTSCGVCLKCFNRIPRFKTQKMISKAEFLLNKILK